MENTLPSRFEETYCEKMKFDKYEYTNFIAYELARRNENVMNLLLIQEELIALYNPLSKSISRYKKAKATEELLQNAQKLENCLKGTLRDLFKHYSIDQFDDDINRLTLENIKEIFSNIVNEIAKILYEQYYIIYQNDIESLQHIANELYDPLRFLERDRFLTQYMLRVYDNEQDYKANHNINFNQNQYFMVYQEVPKEQRDFSFNVIYPKFEKAMRDFTDTKVAMNLNLSESEIIDYIKKIKKNYDSKNSIVKTKRELLVDELESSNEDIKMNSADKWADNFFIYDYFLYHEVISIDKTEAQIKREIQIELTKFHGVRVPKDDYEIKNTKDTKYKYIPLEKYKTQEGYSQNNDIFETLLDENQAMSIRTIGDKYELMKNYIQGENPLYKTLLEK